MPLLTGEWRNALTDKPQDNQHCHIRGGADVIRLNVTYKVDGDGWLDLFDTPEAGAFFTTKMGVKAWVPVELIEDPPDAMLEDPIVPAPPAEPAIPIETIPVVTVIPDPEATDD